MSDHAPSPRANLLRRDYVHCPITALAFFSSTTAGGDSKLYILSGEDTHLHIRDASTSRLCASVQIFPAQPIHGISSSPSSSSPSLAAEEEGKAQCYDAYGSILIWGGPYVTVLTRSTIEHILLHTFSSSSRSTSPRSLQLPILKAPDWIYHGAVSSRDPSRAAVVTAHNEVLPLHIIITPSDGGDGDDHPQQIIEPRLKFGRLRAPRTSRPILYSAQVRWTGEDEVLVAAGTVFGEIVVWRCQGGLLLTTSEEENEGIEDGVENWGVEVLFVFTGHEGSIFGVDISPEIMVPDDDSNDYGNLKSQKRTVRLLASCSDDRTIRIWDITDLDNARAQQDDKQQKHRHHFTEARETGFGENICSHSGDLEVLASHVSSSSRPLAMAMGHVSRIWNVRFAPLAAASSSLPGNINDKATVAAKPAAAEGLVLYSFGEDASAQKWRLDLDTLRTQQQRQDDQLETSRPLAADAPLALPLSHQATLLRHGGKHIWSSAVFESGRHASSGNRRTLVATGGSDGKINLVEDFEGGYTGSVMLTVSGSEVARSFSPANDGLINALTQDHSQNQNHEVEEHIPSPPKAKSTKKRRKAKEEMEEEPFVMYALLSSTSFLATTSAGRIFHGSLRGASVEWQQVPLARDIRDDLQRYQIVQGLVPKSDEHSSPGLALLGSTTGKLYLYNNDHGSVHQIYQMPGKIADIFLLPADALVSLGLIIPASEELSSSKESIPIIVTTMGNPQTMRLLLIDTTITEGAILQEFTIELEKGFIVTAAGYCQEHLIFGSRNGALAVYKVAARGTSSTEEVRPNKFQQVSRVDRPFTKDAVSSIIALPTKNPSSPSLLPFASCPYFLTTSRDGRYRIYELTTTPTSPNPNQTKASSAFSSSENSPLQIHLRHEAVPPFGPIIEGAFFTNPPTTIASTTATDDKNQAPELILSGFRGKEFIVWNETRQIELANVECGGAFRAFTYHVGESNITFVWTKASRTCIYSYSSSLQENDGGGCHNDESGAKFPPAPQQQQQMIANATGVTTAKTGGHGREIKAVAACGNLLATAAEDTTLRIWRVVPPSPSQKETEWKPVHLCGGDLSSASSASAAGMECLAVVEKHTAGIQHLKWVAAGSDHKQPQKYLYLVSSSGNEELFIWRVATLPESRYEGLAVMCEGVYTDKTRDGDLRIMGFDVEVLPNNNTVLSPFGGGGHNACDCSKNNDKKAGDDEETEVALCISLVLSNSTLRTYRYSKTEGFVLLARGKYTGACLMQIRHLNILTTPINTTISVTDHHEKGRVALSEIHVLTASTDGHIALWKTTAMTLDPPSSSSSDNEGEYILIEVSRLHQSGIKSFDLQPIPSFSSPTTPSPSSYVLVTGGDDNALGFAHLTWIASSPPQTLPPTKTATTDSEEMKQQQQQQQHFSLMGRSLVSGAHAAAITGLCITNVDSSTTSSSSEKEVAAAMLPSSTGTTTTHHSPRQSVTLTICTASNDQRVKTWRMNVNVKARDRSSSSSSSSSEEAVVQKVSLVANRYSSVADCGDLEMVSTGDGLDRAAGSRRRIVVAGVGMEAWTV